MNSSRALIDEDCLILSQSLQYHMNEIMGASTQFKEDMNVILQTFESNVFVLDVLNSFVSKILKIETCAKLSQFQMMKQFKQML